MDDQLVAVSVPADVATTVEMHETVVGDATGAAGTGAHDMTDDTAATMTMRQVSAVELPAGEAVVFGPGGLHVMLLGLADATRIGLVVRAHVDVRHRGTRDRDGRRPRRGPVRGHRRSRWMVAFTLPALVLGACGGSDDAEGRLPDIEVETLRGGDPFRLDELEGPAVVNLWATWCAPCKRELPEFEAVHRSVAGEVTFVGVNIGDDGDEAADYLDDLGITYDQYLDVDSELTAALKTATLPMTLIIDDDEQITLRHIGPLDQGELIEAIGQQERGST